MELIEKIQFLQSGFVPALQQLPADAPRKWGKMNVQQMIEHMSEYVRMASGKMPMELVTPADKLERAQRFLASDKPFPDNTPNVLMPEEPVPVKHANKESAIEELAVELQDFFAAYQGQEDKRVTNPFFGHLDFEQQVQLLYKHATHHLRQFGA